jgi:hypothetical protein
LLLSKQYAIAMSETQGLSSVNAEFENSSSDTQPNDAILSDQAMAGSASPSSDPASTLRAAALLTLKSKRRKPPPDQMASLSQRPIPSGLVLNYGEEESTPSTMAPPSVTGKRAASLTKTAASEAEDNREEGEISDTESTPLAVSKPKGTPKKASKPKANLNDKQLTSKSSPISAKQTMKPPPVTEQQMESPPTTPVAGSSRYPASSFVIGQPQVPPYAVDADHVRPGLASSSPIFDLR